ncbi:Asp23/Gls24 family envelope stress response protein [Candidatus Soleaferrea massiliensis]|uniref:Asp23/Gls24 family envelope stress response protein n=1 Tax=Candidatus Soleaferrea massiliensis TaxID=1470354 RepID=UPI00058E8525|nr:Asp23/Gls24 family envelope stress response protein [Candidatus Soleaferrea massiliensis]
MIVIENYLGVIEVSEAFVTNLIRMSVSECFGVNRVGEPDQPENQKPSKKKQMSLVTAQYTKAGLVVDLHIEVPYGVNIVEVVKSVKEKIRYNVKETLDIPVSAVHVYIDGMRV